MIKKVVQQGRSDFDARSVLPVREHDKIARTPLVAFFNLSITETGRSLAEKARHTQAFSINLELLSGLLAK